MKLVEKHLIKTSKPAWEEIDNLCFNSKNLYNCAVYQCRQAFFNNKLIPNFNQLYHLLKVTDDYKALPAKVSQLIIKQVSKSFKSYLATVKAYNKDSSKFLGFPKLPRYKHKEKGRNILTYNYQAVSKKALRLGLIKPSGTNLSIPTNQSQIDEVRMIPKGGSYVIEVVYEIEEIKPNITEHIRINPQELFDGSPFGMSQAVCDLDSRLVFVSGQVDWNQKYQTSESSVEGQTKKALENLQIALEKADSSVDNLLQIRIYIRGEFGDYMNTIAPIISSFLGKSRPAVTGIGVASLASPETLVEIEAIAKIHE